MMRKESVVANTYTVYWIVMLCFHSRYFDISFEKQFANCIADFSVIFLEKLM